MRVIYRAGKLPEIMVMALDRKKKMLTIYRLLHPQADISRLYVKRSQGGRGLISVEDCVNIEVGSLYQYVVKSPERLLMATKSENVLDEGVVKESVHVSQRRLSSYREKTIQGQYVRVTEEIRDPRTWDWLEKVF